MDVTENALPELAPSLASIVAPISVRGFLDCYWRQRVFFCQGSRLRLGPLMRELGATDIARLVWQSRHCVVLWAHDTEPHSQRLSMAAAVEAYEHRGATLYFRMRDDWPLSRWTFVLADELGEPPIGVTGFFAVRGESGTRPHIDWNDNLTIQIVGTKRWLVAPNGFVKHPVTNWTIGDPPPPYAYSSLLPAELPPDAAEYVLTPGSVLYVPRGYLHHVTSVDTVASLSLSIGFPPTPWAVVLSTLLSNRLLEDPEFREGLCGAFGNGWGRAKILEQLPGMMEKFCQRAGGIGEALEIIMQHSEKLSEYLVRRAHPQY